MTTGPVRHEHTYQGQTLVHSHTDGDEPHGYYGHAEDGTVGATTTEDNLCPACNGAGDGPYCLTCKDTGYVRIRRYRLVHSRCAAGEFSEFSADSDQEAIEVAKRGLYGARIVSLVEVEHQTPSGIVSRPVEVVVPDGD